MAYHFDRLFREVFSCIIKKYNFYVKSINEQEVALINEDKNIILSFVFSIDGVDTCYVEPINNEQFKVYYLREYIANHITDKDRHGINLEFNTFYEKHIVILNILAKVLQNHSSSILRGDKKWLEDYKNSPYFVEPRIINR